MTRDEILNMPAGREMDVLVLVSVMGIEYSEKDGENYREWSNCYTERACFVFRDIPHYSADISAAWEVVEKLRDTSDDEPDYWTITDLGNAWRVTSNWAHHDGDIENFSIEAETAPLAICRAALLAVMVTP
jgi:hypothetical protein